MRGDRAWWEGVLLECECETRSRKGVDRWIRSGRAEYPVGVVHLWEFMMRHGSTKGVSLDVAGYTKGWPTMLYD